MALHVQLVNLKTSQFKMLLRSCNNNTTTTSLRSIEMCLFFFVFVFWWLLVATLTRSISFVRSFGNSIDDLDGRHRNWSVTRKLKKPSVVQCAIEASVNRERNNKWNWGRNPVWNEEDDSLEKGNNNRWTGFFLPTVVFLICYCHPSFIISLIRKL